jgi:hypothetical protein
MTAPFLSVSAALLYFGWLWHDRKAADRSEDGSRNGPLQDTNRTGETHALQPAPFETVTATPSNLKQVFPAVAEGAAQ